MGANLRREIRRLSQSESAIGLRNLLAVIPGGEGDMALRIRSHPSKPLDGLIDGLVHLANVLDSTLLFDFARPQVDSIYGMKEGEKPWVLTLLMLFIIGPAEEVFWRGCIQNRLSARWNPNVGFILTTLVYGLVHVSKFNFMLIMAAMVAGFVWGLAYRFFPEKIGAIIISHALWDCAVFIWFPIM